jgi:hypothetical protein
VNKTAIIIGVGLLLAASQAFADSAEPSGETVALASDSGILVRVAAEKAASSRESGNVYASAVNTAGVTRATKAAKVGGRVFLTGGRSVGSAHTALASAQTYKAPAAKRPQRPQGLGGLLAKVFGVRA